MNTVSARSTDGSTCRYLENKNIQEHAETSKHRGTNQQTETVTITITKHA